MPLVLSQDRHFRPSHLGSPSRVAESPSSATAALLRPQGPRKEHGRPTPASRTCQLGAEYARACAPPVRRQPVRAFAIFATLFSSLTDVPTRARQLLHFSGRGELVHAPRVCPGWGAVLAPPSSRSLLSRCRTLLRREPCPRARPPAPAGYHIPRPETGEPPHWRRRPHQGH